MAKPIRILLQTTIPYAENDWSIERFSLLREHIGSLGGEIDGRCIEVTARNREENAAGDDVVLSRLEEHGFDELWLFAVDVGNGLSAKDCESIDRFRRRGRGILAARDHEDLGSCLRPIRGFGKAFRLRAPLSKAAGGEDAVEDADSSAAYWPNYRSGNNGDYQRIHAVEPLHPLMQYPGSPSGSIEYFPAHPHEGAIDRPEAEPDARVIATGTNLRTGRPFDLTVAFEARRDAEGNDVGRAVAESSFHRFVDYNWDIGRGCPGFVEELPADGIARDPRKLEHVKRYVRNLVAWLAPRN